MQLLVVYFTHLSLVLSVRYRLCTAKKVKTVTYQRRYKERARCVPSRQCKLCHNAININYVLMVVYVQNYKRAQSLVCHGPS